MLDITKINNLDGNRLDRIRDVCLASLACLLLDQYDSKMEGAVSWGKSSVDYRFLATPTPSEEKIKTIDEGSITHTAWALQALREFHNSSLLPSDIFDAIIKAQASSVHHIKEKLGKGISENPDVSEIRHNATSLLAYECLPEAEKDLDASHYFARCVSPHFQNLREALEDWANQPKSKSISTDIAIVAAYVSVLNSFITSTSKNSSLSESDRIH